MGRSVFHLQYFSHNCNIFEIVLHTCTPTGGGGAAAERSTVLAPRVDAMLIFSSAMLTLSQRFAGPLPRSLQKAGAEQSATRETCFVGKPLAPCPSAEISVCPSSSFFSLTYSRLFHL